MTDAASSSPRDSAAGSAEQFACRAARLMSDNRCEDVAVLDLRGRSQVTDFTVIATGTSERQMGSVAEDLKLLAKVDDQGVYRSHGAGTDQWVVVDFVDVVAHVFERTQRLFYDIESLWGDAPRLDWEAVTEPGQFADIRQMAQRS